MRDRPTPRPSAELLSAHTPELLDRAVTRAVEFLQAGKVVALPTETVYGLAANALDPSAVANIFAVKRRPASNPLIVHVASKAMARACVRDWPPAAELLATAFWPGPLTIILPRSGSIPDRVTAGGDTVGIRWPAHPLIQRVIRECGFPLAAPSANLANEVSCTTAAHVVASLGHRVPLVVDGGQSQVGIESTVVDLTRVPARIMRPGSIHFEALRGVLGEAIEAGPSAVDPNAPTPGRPLQSPGQFPRHYAPRARLIVLTWTNDADLARQLARYGARLPEVHVIAHHQIPSDPSYGRVCVIPQDAEAYARAMYAEWHRCDELGAKWIVVETVPDEPEWFGIADRLQRASHPADP